VSTAAQDHDWGPLAFLLGRWIGEGGGDPGQGSGWFSFAPDLANFILVRTNHAEYPATPDRPAATHDDLMIIYPDPAGGPWRAIYFDGERHVIEYSVEAAESPGTVRFSSPPTPAQPGFRLTYAATGPDTLTLTFEIAPPGESSAFAPYIEAQARRAPPA
jgi:hypothetical protein